MGSQSQPTECYRRSTRRNANHILKYLDENGVLHMCKTCRFVLIAGDVSKKIMVVNFYSDPPDDTNFIVCPECSKETNTRSHKLGYVLNPELYSI
jgi:hypothetical protein